MDGGSNGKPFAQLLSAELVTSYVASWNMVYGIVLVHITGRVDTTPSAPSSRISRLTPLTQPSA